MIKVFTLNKNGKIEITKEELQSLLDKNYWDGYTNGQATKSWTYHSPYWGDYITCNSSNTANTTVTNVTPNGITIETEANK